MDDRDHAAGIALVAVSHGDLGAWRGLPAGLDRTIVEQAIGPGGQEGSGSLGGLPLRFRMHPATVAALFGLTVWYEDDETVAIEVLKPALPAPLKEVLGEPEAIEPSVFGSGRVQFIYAGRRLTGHVSEISEEVAALCLYRPMSLDAYRSSPFARVRSERIAWPR